MYQQTILLNVFSVYLSYSFCNVAYCPYTLKIVQSERLCYVGNDRFHTGLAEGYVIQFLFLPFLQLNSCLMQMLKHAKVLTAIPLVGPLLIPPVRVTSVAKVAVSAATDPTFPHGIIDVYSILQHSQQKSA